MIKHQKLTQTFINYLIALLIIACFIIPTALAKEQLAVEHSSDMLLPYPHNNPDDIFGLNQYYSIVFDSEGEATVLVKLRFQNLNDTPVDELRLEIPGRNIRMVAVMQEFPGLEKYCEEYECIINQPYGGCAEQGGYCKRLIRDLFFYFFSYFML